MVAIPVVLPRVPAHKTTNLSVPHDKPWFSIDLNYS